MKEIAPSHRCVFAVAAAALLPFSSGSRKRRRRIGTGQSRSGLSRDGLRRVVSSSRNERPGAQCFHRGPPGRRSRCVGSAPGELLESILPWCRRVRTVPSFFAWEGDTRMPLIVHGPDRAASAISSAMLSQVDLAASIVASAGGTVPAGAAPERVIGNTSRPVNVSIGM